MADFYYAGQNYTDIQTIKLPEPDNAGGVVPFYSMDGSLDWMGPDAELIKTIYEADVKLSDTAYNGWAVSTTAKTIQATITISTTYTSAHLDIYSYAIEWLLDINLEYDGTQDNKARVVRQCGTQWQDIHRRPYGFDNIASLTDSYNYCTTITSATVYTIYYNSSGTYTWTAGVGYGIYATPTAATFSNTTNTNPTITFKTPVLSARCSTTYFKTANAGKVVQADSIIKIRGRLYRRPAQFSNMRNLYRTGAYLYSHPIEALQTE